VIKPLFNNCLIEVVNEYEGIVGSDKNENVQKGVLRNYTLVKDHLTASTGYSVEGYIEYAEELNKLKDKVVYWQEYADSGSKFDIAGKQYVLVPFYRLLGFDDETTKETK
jgi:hypothetical protein